MKQSLNFHLETHLQDEKYFTMNLTLDQISSEILTVKP